MTTVNKYVFSLERGVICGNMHLQGVVTLTCKSVYHLRRILNDIMCWGTMHNHKSEHNSKSTWTLRVHTGDGLHTFWGMCGYCLKDEGMPRLAPGQ